MEIIPHPCSHIQGELGAICRRCVVAHESYGGGVERRRPTGVSGAQSGGSGVGGGRGWAGQRRRRRRWRRGEEATRGSSRRPAPAGAGGARSRVGSGSVAG